MNVINKLSIAALVASALGLSALALPTAAYATTEHCEHTDQATIAALFDRWNTSLKTLDSHKVTANYASDAVLLATISNKPRTTHAEIDDYFVQFLKIEPSGVIDTRTIKVGCNIAQDVGTYTFSLKGGKKVSARYTYVYQFKDGKWLIAHHHSSAMPETNIVK